MDATFDPNSLQGLLSQFQPTEADRQAARHQAQIQFFLGLLGAPKGAEWQRIGLSGMHAMQDYNDQLVNSQKAALARMQAANLGMSTLEKQQQLKDMQALRQAGIDWAKQGGGNGLPQIGAPSTPGAPGVGGAMPTGAMQPSPKRAQYEQAMAYAQFLKSRGLVQQALAQEQHALTLLPKRVDTKTLTTPDGKRAVVNIYDDGTQEVLPFGPDQEKLHFADTGGGVQGLNPLTGQAVGAAIPKTVSPDAQLSSSTAMRGQDITARGQNLANARGLEANAIARSKLEIAQAGEARKEEAVARQGQSQVEMADRVLGMIDKAAPMAGAMTTGLTGSVLGKIPGRKAYDLRALADSIKANLGFEQLQAMRQASPTGGALGQVSDMENRLLASTVANLDPNQSQEQFMANLQEVKRHLANVRGLIAQAQGVPSTAPAPSVGGKSIVRTGTYNGRRVVQYSDGTTEYAQ